MQFSEEKKLLWTGSVGKLKKTFFFFRVGPKNMVGWDMGNR